MMATLQIPDELVEAFINYTVGSNCIALDDEEAIIGLIVEFAKNTLGLLPCPFERPRQEHNVKIVPGTESYVECSCGASGALGIALTDAIEAWNKRSDDGICPWCGRDEYWKSWLPSQYVCSDCDGYGPEANTPEEALRLWKRIAD